MDGFGRHLQLANAESPFNVAERLPDGDWNAQSLHATYDAPASSHTAPGQGVQDQLGNVGSHLYQAFKVDGVETPSMNSRGPWIDPQLISLPTHGLAYAIEGTTVPLPTPAPPNGVMAPNRLIHYVNDSEEPWYPTPMILELPPSKTSCYPVYSVLKTPFNPGPGSDEFPPSDSGYGTQHQAPSATGRSLPSVNPESSHLNAGMSALEMSSLPGSQLEDVADDSLDTYEQAARSGAEPSRVSREGKVPCKLCSRKLNCPSDLKKHMLTHEKIHRCDVLYCSRTEGFGTVNDLNRHKASVHKILDKSRKFKCAAPGCRTPEKIWPRLDNFKQHLDRMHQAVDDVNKIVELSETKAAMSCTNAAAFVMSNDLDGVGAGASSSGLLMGVTDSDYLAIPHDPCSPTSIARNSTAQHPDQSRRSHEQDDQLRQLDPASDSDLAIARGRVKSRSEQNQHQDLVLVAIRPAGSTMHASSDDNRGGTMWVARRAQSTWAEVNGQFTNTSGNAYKDEQTLSTHDGKIPCPDPNCNKTFKRRCELNKHEKRHSLPYVCTAFGCSHHSGSKSDWQRHEKTCGHEGRESLHSENDTVRVCLELDASGANGKCGFMHTSQDSFIKHLRKTHNIMDEEHLQACLLRYRPPDHGPGIGWCGFCASVVQWAYLTANEERRSSRLGAGTFTDRAVHIDYHVTKEGRHMNNYIRLDTHMKKGVASNDKLQHWFHNEQHVHAHHQKRPGNIPLNHKKRKRGACAGGGSDDESKRRVNEANWWCCQCGITQLHKLYERCSGVNCDHPRCQWCEDVTDQKRAK